MRMRERRTRQETEAKERAGKLYSLMISNKRLGVGGGGGGRRC